jgi:hypothetical protein
VGYITAAKNVEEPPGKTTANLIGKSIEILIDQIYECIRPAFYIILLKISIKI